jgi:hypothetical protein
LFKYTFPILILTNLNVGKPTAEVIFLTCRNFPSFKVIEAQEVGPCRSSRIFFPLSPKFGTSEINEALQGLVMYFDPLNPISTPF